MQTLEEIEQLIKNTPALILYFSTPTCNVCHALKPKLFSAIKETFKEIQLVSIDISQEPEIAAQFSVFTAPTVLFYLDSKEFLRKSRNLSVEAFIEEIKRPYNLFFS